uniref:Uncharacterized protein n=1 Tax=Glossina brevipalpis TaxID=37001 RepID=A0A1A9WA12_9MUSC
MHVRTYLKKKYYHHYRMERNYDDILPVVNLNVPPQRNSHDSEVHVLENMYRYLCRGDEPWEWHVPPNTWCTTDEAGSVRERISLEIRALARAGGYGRHIPEIKAPRATQGPTCSSFFRNL